MNTWETIQWQLDPNGMNGFCGDHQNMDVAPAIWNDPSYTATTSFASQGTFECLDPSIPYQFDPALMQDLGLYNAQMSNQTSPLPPQSGYTPYETSTSPSEPSPTPYSTSRESSEGYEGERGRKTRANSDSSEQSYAKPSSDNSDSEATDAKRQRALQRNRASASKWRKKKKSAMRSLEDKAQQLDREHEALIKEVTTLQSELFRLKVNALDHLHCDCSGIREYMTRNF